MIRNKSACQRADVGSRYFRTKTGRDELLEPVSTPSSREKGDWTKEFGRRLRANASQWSLSMLFCYLRVGRSLALELSQSESLWTG